MELNERCKHNKMFYIFQEEESIKHNIIILHYIPHNTQTKRFPSIFLCLGILLSRLNCYLLVYCMSQTFQLHDEEYLAMIPAGCLFKWNQGYVYPAPAGVGNYVQRSNRHVAAVSSHAWPNNYGMYICKQYHIFECQLCFSSASIDHRHTV